MKRAVPEDLMRKLSAYGATVSETREIDHATQYRLTKGSESATLNVYSTNKVSEGGKESGLKNLLREWRLSGKGGGKPGSNAGSKKKAKSKPPFSVAPEPNATPRVGTDEAGKGEYFGPLVVAGVRVLSGETDGKLLSIGVRDSKDIGLAEVRRLAGEIYELVGDANIRAVCLPPREYETRREKAGSNVNRLLGEMNAEIITHLQSEVEVAVVDAFGVKAAEYVEASLSGGVRVEARPRAEDDAAVAAASIIARSRYLEEMDKLSEGVGFELPRGSTHVIGAAKRVYGERGREGLRDVAKVHFSTTDKVVG
ncbi:MAG: hypothetical protein M3494_01815 [Actinomycetota bacterium]|nr:hypothetical protein [Rubrobacter sp.]MDQ3506745.1 hypothetical protein [Actinomycetota bacterium]